MSEPNAAGANPGPSRNSVAVVVVTMALLALLVWFLNPRQPDFKPAPLDPPAEKCLNPERDFVPTNLVEFSDPALNALPTEERIRAIHSLNESPCTCGCQLSIASCPRSNSHCETSPQMFRKIVSERKKEAEATPEKK